MAGGGQSDVGTGRFSGVWTENTDGAAQHSARPQTGGVFTTSDSRPSPHELTDLHRGRGEGLGLVKKGV